MRVLDIVDNTIVDGPGLRLSIYFAGCQHHCPGCHNPESWDMNGGTEYTPKELLTKILESGKKKITLSGGDPLYQPINELNQLCQLIKQEIPGSNIWLYTGFRAIDILHNAYKKSVDDNPFENLVNYLTYSTIIHYVDTIVDGPFIEKYKDENLQFRGSSNQHIININGPFATWFRRNYAIKQYMKGNVSKKFVENLEGFTIETLQSEN